MKKTPSSGSRIKRSGSSPRLPQAREQSNPLQNSSSEDVAKSGASFDPAAAVVAEDSIPEPQLVSKLNAKEQRSIETTSSCPPGAGEGQRRPSGAAYPRSPRFKSSSVPNAKEGRLKIRMPPRNENSSAIRLNPGKASSLEPSSPRFANKTQPDSSSVLLMGSSGNDRQIEENLKKVSQLVTPEMDLDAFVKEILVSGIDLTLRNKAGVDIAGFAYQKALFFEGVGLQEAISHVEEGIEKNNVSILKSFASAAEEVEYILPDSESLSVETLPPMPTRIFTDAMDYKYERLRVLRSEPGEQVEGRNQYHSELAGELFEHHITGKMRRNLKKFQELLRLHLSDLWIKSLALSKGLADNPKGSSEQLGSWLKLGSTLLPVPYANLVVNLVVNAGLKIKKRHNKAQEVAMTEGAGVSDIYEGSLLVEKLVHEFTCRHQFHVMILSPYSLDSFAVCAAKRMMNWLSTAYYANPKGILSAIASGSISYILGDVVGDSVTHLSEQLSSFGKSSRGAGSDFFGSVTNQAKGFLPKKLSKKVQAPEAVLLESAAEELEGLLDALPVQERLKHTAMNMVAGTSLVRSNQVVQALELRQSTGYVKKFMIQSASRVTKSLGLSDDNHVLVMDLLDGHKVNVSAEILCNDTAVILKQGAQLNHYELAGDPDPFVAEVLSQLPFSGCYIRAEELNLRQVAIKAPRRWMKLPLELEYDEVANDMVLRLQHKNNFLEQSLEVERQVHANSLGQLRELNQRLMAENKALQYKVSLFSEMPTTQEIDLNPFIKLHQVLKGERAAETPQQEKLIRSNQHFAKLVDALSKLPTREALLAFNPIPANNSHSALFSPDKEVLLPAYKEALLAALIQLTDSEKVSAELRKYIYFLRGCLSAVSPTMAESADISFEQTVYKAFSSRM